MRSLTAFLLASFLAAVIIVPGIGRGPGLVDAGELAAAVACDGIPHPTGFAPYLFLASLVPGSNGPAALVSLPRLSAGLGILAAGLLGAFVTRLLSAARSRAVAVIAGTAAGVLLASSRSVWWFSHVTEVYTMEAAIALLALLVAVTGTGSGRGRPVAVGVLAGTAVSLHPPIAAGLLAGLLPLAWLPIRRDREALPCSDPAARGWREMGLSVLVGIVAFAGWSATLLVRARNEPALNWGDPSSVSSLAYHVLGGRYVGRVFDSVHLIQTWLTEGLPPWRIFASDATIALPAAAVAGLVVLVLRRRWNVALAAVLGAAFSLTWATGYNVFEDRAAYILPATVWCVVLVCVSAGEIGMWLGEGESHARMRRMAAIGCVALPLVLALGLAFSRAPGMRHDLDPFSRIYVDGLFAGRPQGSLYLTFEFSDASSLWEMQSLRRERTRDVVVYVPALELRWFVRKLHREAPDLVPDPDAFGRAGGGDGRTSKDEGPGPADRFLTDRIRQIVERAWRSGRSVYFSPSLGWGIAPPKARRCPDGLFFRLLPPATAWPLESVPPPAPLHGDGSFYRDPVMERRTIARFGRMAYATAVYQLNRGRVESIDATRALLWRAIQETFDPDTRGKSLELIRRLDAAAAGAATEAPGRIRR